ncbi:MAG: PilZ domain-containing protein [Croceibacterium sp.]
MEDRRRSTRHEVDVEGVIRSGNGVEHAVAISNLSLDGCRFTASGRRIPAGTPLALSVGPVDLLHARVAWRVGAVHGVSFDQALHPAVLDRIRLFLSTEPALIEERPAA